VINSREEARNKIILVVACFSSVQFASPDNARPKFASTTSNTSNTSNTEGLLTRVYPLVECQRDFRQLSAADVGETRLSASNLVEDQDSVHTAIIIKYY
jgi:hypothetical protein